MIPANELRIGNWLYVSGNTIDTYQTSKPKQVNIEFLNAIKVENEERPDGFLTWFNPIPLAPEILEKCGFEFKPTGEEVYEQIWKIGSFEIWEHDSGFCHDFHHGGDVNHLHQLQNLYFALTGKELTFNP